MNLNDFYYDLDESFIAQTPLENRADSKLLVLSKNTGEIVHDRFFSILKFCFVLSRAFV